MTITRTSLHLLRTAAAGLLVAAVACGGSDPAPATTPSTAPSAAAVALSDEDARAAGVETATARAIERADPLDATGVVTFDERRTVRLGSLVQGVVSEVPVQPGDRVARGEVVARLHSHVVHDAWAAYFKAIADHQRSETELAYAATAEARAARLVADKALSPQELHRARADVNAARQALRAASAEITRTEQELEHYGITAEPDAEPQSHDTSPVVSPIAGVVIERSTTEGAAVTPGSPLVMISDLSRVWIAAEIDEVHVGRVAAGRPVTARVAAYPGESFAGTVAAIGDVVNPATRRVTVRVEAPNPDRRLKPQMFVTITLAAGAPRRVLVVPSAAVQTMNGETVVFVRTTAGQFSRRAVTLGTDVAGEVEVVRGLAEGDVVATAGAFMLKSALAAPAGDE